MTQYNYVDSSGLVLQQLADIVTQLEEGFQSIYGSDINLDPSSPDGQMIALFAQAKIDILDCISDVYSSFSPTSAIGSALDQRCAINGVTRKGATKTTVSVNIVADRTVTLPGADNSTSPFTISDVNGNKFFLVTGATLSAGTSAHEFIAQNAGVVEVTVGNITKIETLTLGIVSVTNPGNATIKGTDEETDSALRYRRALSVSMPSQGYLEGLRTSLLALDNVTDAIVYENNTDATDINSIPPHSIWAVVEGGLDADIANVIYVKRNVGCGMYGSEDIEIDQGNGFTIPISFGRAQHINLYIKLTVTSLDANHDIDDDFLKQEIYDKVTYSINQIADYSAIASLVKIADPLCVIISGAVGSAVSPTEAYAVPTTIDSRWIVSTARISITVV